MMAPKYGLPFLAGSAARLKSAEDEARLQGALGFPGGGHAAAIRFSALNPEFGWENMRVQLDRRCAVIESEPCFMTDRSPLDTMVYMVNQCGYSPLVTEAMLADAFEKALGAWMRLDVVVYVRQVNPQPMKADEVRVANRYYQRCLDAQFSYWLEHFFRVRQGQAGPRIVEIDSWDLDERVRAVSAAIEERASTGGRDRHS